MAERYATALDCADISFLPDGTLDELPQPSRLGATRTGGIDLNKPRIRAALAAALALAAAPHGFTIAEHAAKVAAMTGLTGYTIRQAAYDLRKLRSKGLAVKPGRTRRYHIPPEAARTIAALLALRDHVIAPILAGVRSPRMGRSPPSGLAWTATTRPSASACRPSAGRPGQQPFPFPLHVLPRQHGPLRDPVDDARAGLPLQPVLQRAERRVAGRAALRLDAPVPPDPPDPCRRDRHDLAEHRRLARADPRRPPDGHRRPVTAPERRPPRSGETRSDSRTATISPPAGSSPSSGTLTAARDETGYKDTGGSCCEVRSRQSLF